MASVEMAKAQEWGSSAPSSTNAVSSRPGSSRTRELLKRQGAGRSALLLVLDFRKGMLETSPDGRPLLSHALRVVAGVLKDKIVSRARDYIGVVAFGCNATKNRLHLHNITVIKPLSVPDATSIMRLERLTEKLDQQARNGIKEEEEEITVNDTLSGDIDFGHLPDEAFGMKNVIWVARHMFAMYKSGARDSGFDVLGRRMIIFTNDVDPSRGDDEITRLAVTQAKDLVDTGAVADLMIMTTTEDKVESVKDSLKAAKFYLQVFMQQNEDATSEGSIYVTPTSKLQDMGAKVRRKIQTKRAHATVELNIGLGLKIGVQIYSMVRKTTKPVATKLAPSTNLPAVRQSAVMCSHTAVPLTGDQIRYGYKVGESFAAFSSKEIETIKTVSNLGMTLYGYVSQERLRHEENLSPPLFVYPSDTKLAGSTALFASLHDKLSKRKLMAIVLSQLRKKGEARFAALFPQQEVKDKEGNQIKPPGFLMVYLPYKNDLYDQWRAELQKAAETSNFAGGLETEIEPPRADTADLSEEDRTVPKGSLAAKEMVRKLMVHNFDASDYYHPEIQRHFAVLQAVALGHENFGETEDSLQPDDAKMKKLAEEQMDKFASLTLGSDFDGATVASSYAKKKGTAADEAAREQKATKRKAKTDLKQEVAMEGLDVERFRQLAADEELEKLKVKDLKQYCEAYALKTSGNKSALIARVSLHLSQASKA